MPTKARSKWEIIGQGEKRVIEGTRVELDANSSRVTFFDGDEVVASFIGLTGFVKV